MRARPMFQLNIFIHIGTAGSLLPELHMPSEMCNAITRRWLLMPTSAMARCASRCSAALSRRGDQALYIVMY